MNNKTKNFIIEYCKKHPLATINDLFKALHQSTFGCGHLVNNNAFNYLLTEIENFVPTNDTIECLPGKYSRLHLSHAHFLGLSPNTIYKIFELSSQEKTETVDSLENKLCILLNLAKEGVISLNPDECVTKIQEWKKADYSMLRHSVSYRTAYTPAYRVIHNKFIPYLELLSKIDSFVSNGKNVILAIEGGSASGKTTLSELLSKIYNCNVFHMDDFFLQPFQRTTKRLSTPGGNIDSNRFLDEVLIPLSKKETVCYKKFDCSTQKMLKPIEIPFKNINIIEGAYSMHPQLSSYYNISVFLEIDKQLQIQRIQKRNAAALQQRFFNEWIPLEKLYFDTFNIIDKCDYVINNIFN